MNCERKLIYFSSYENGVKTRSAGYAGVFVRGNVCDVQIFYREEETEPDGAERRELNPVYIFRDSTVVEGEALPLEEGMAAANIRTMRTDFMQSGRSLEELEAIYIDGTAKGICGGRPDGQDLTMEVAYTLMEDIVPEKSCEEPWTLMQCMERLPELKLPFDGIRRKCCRMTLQDIKHLPEEWAYLGNNHFLLHGYYEYHHLLLAQLSCRYGEKYAIGVPGEFCYRSQYMAERYGFYDFAPLEQGRRRGGSFGYWYYYLSSKTSTI